MTVTSNERETCGLIVITSRTVGVMLKQKGVFSMLMLKQLCHSSPWASCHFFRPHV